MPFDYAVPSVPDGSRIDYSDGLLDPRREIPTVPEGGPMAPDNVGSRKIYVGNICECNAGRPIFTHIVAITTAQNNADELRYGSIGRICGGI